MLALCLAMLPSVTPPPLVMADKGLTGPVRPDALAYYSAFFANQLRGSGVKVVASDAAGVVIEAVVSGTLARFGEDGMQVSLTVVNPDGETLAARSFTARDEGELYEVLRAAAQELALELFKRLEKMPVPQAQVALPPEPARPGSIAPGLAAAGLGAAVLAGGVALSVHAWSQLSAVRGGVPTTYAAASAQANGARTYSTVSMVLLAVGGAAAVGGLAYTFTIARSNRALLRVTPAAAPAPGGGTLVLSGEF